MGLRWIDKLEQRVGLRPPEEPERPLNAAERAEVIELSSEAVSVIQGLFQSFPELADNPSVRAAAEEVMKGHDEFMAMISADEREEQMRSRSSDVPDRG